MAKSQSTSEFWPFRTFVWPRIWPSESLGSWMVRARRSQQLGIVSSRTRESRPLANLKDPGLAGGRDFLVRELTADMRVLALDRIQFFNLAVYILIIQQLFIALQAVFSAPSGSLKAIFFFNSEGDKIWNTFGHSFFIQGNHCKIAAIRMPQTFFN